MKIIYNKQEIEVIDVLNEYCNKNSVHMYQVLIEVDNVIFVADVLATTRV